MRGKLALAGITDTRTPIADWLDAIYVILIELAHGPHEPVGAAMERLENQLDILAAQLDPAGARETWGLEPHQAEAARRLEQESRPMP